MDTRSRKPSLKDCPDFADLLRETEERIIRSFKNEIDTLRGQISNIERKMSQIEIRIDNTQANQIKIDNDVTLMREIIVNQQKQLEKYEADKRRKNLIVSGIPESPVRIENSSLEDDASKLTFIMREVSQEFSSDSITSISRLGQKSSHTTRLLKIEFNDATLRDDIIRSQRRLRENQCIVKTFGKIFLNRDGTVLVRREEKRLRDVMKELKNSSTSQDKIFIKRGILYKNQQVVDQVDVVNQLF